MELSKEEIEEARAKHGEEIEFFSKDFPGVPIEEVVKKWVEVNPQPGKVEEAGKEGFGGKDIPAGARD
jgi:hypothetical protein